MYYYRARYYAPSSGRFVSNDPIGFGGGTNFYGYVGNAPSQFVDPSGLCRSDPDQGAPPGAGSPNRRKEKDCLSQMFGGRSVESVQIIEKGRGIGRDADTRRDEIRLYNGTTTDEFFDPSLAPFMLHEYFHVMEQWNTGRLSVWKYIQAIVGPGNKWEREAGDFASAYTDWYLNCLKNP
jgi:hypothetical protein